MEIYRPRIDGQMAWNEVTIVLNEVLVVLLFPMQFALSAIHSVHAADLPQSTEQGAANVLAAPRDNILLPPKTQVLYTDGPHILERPTPIVLKSQQIEVGAPPASAGEGGTRETISAKVVNCGGSDQGEGCAPDTEKLTEAQIERLTEAVAELSRQPAHPVRSTNHEGESLMAVGAVFFLMIFAIFLFRDELMAIEAWRAGRANGVQRPPSAKVGPEVATRNLALARPVGVGAVNTAPNAIVPQQPSTRPAHDPEAQHRGPRNLTPARPVGIGVAGTTTNTVIPQQPSATPAHDPEALRRAHRTRPTYWISLGGRPFEVEFASLLQEVGYKAIVTPQSGDGGIDILAKRDGVQVAIQCKRTAAPATPGMARELLGSMIARRVSHGMLVCTAGFSKGAREFAAQNNIQLVDVHGIVLLAQEAARRANR